MRAIIRSIDSASLLPNGSQFSVICTYILATPTSVEQSNFTTNLDMADTPLQVGAKLVAGMIQSAAFQGVTLTAADIHLPQFVAGA